MNAVEVKNLNFKYKNAKQKILQNVNLTVEQGEIVAITGDSGCGKSTLCNCICGLIPKVYEGIYDGEVYLFGKSVSEMSLGQIASMAGIIFQNPTTQLFSPTVEDELAFGPENLCVAPTEIGRRIDEVLKVTGMEKYRYDNPNRMSGGQQQLIAIASVLMLNPKLLICDEIMSWIDKESKIAVKNIIAEFKNQGKTVIMVEHDEENIRQADRIIHI